jgi:hypothetical protein
MTVSDRITLASVYVAELTEHGCRRFPSAMASVERWKVAARCTVKGGGLRIMAPVSVPTAGGHRADRLLRALAEKLDREAEMSRALTVSALNPRIRLQGSKR